jgi:hypothetical protein
MVQRLGIEFARWILGKHWPYYQIGFHNLVNFPERSSDQLIKAQALSTLY